MSLRFGFWFWSRFWYWFKVVSFEVLFKIVSFESLLRVVSTTSLLTSFLLKFLFIGLLSSCFYVISSIFCILSTLSRLRLSCRDVWLPLVSVLSC